MYVLMQCVAEAVVAKGVRGLAEMVPGGAFLFDVANDAHRRLRDRKRTDQIREEVVAVAAAGIDEVRKVAEQVVKEVAAGALPEEKAALQMYLTQVPGAVRASFRRADDPSGRSVPDQFSLADPADLARRLPAKLPRFRAGEALPGRPGWVLGELLGAGGFGEVWLARNPSLTALRGAVKFSLDPQARERLLRHEGGLVSRVMEEGRHPNIVPLLDAYLEGETPWLMYEYVGGGELGALIHGWQALPAAERTARAVAALRTLAAAVGHVHRLTPPLVHRDLKPANILVSGEGKNASLRVADFGIGGLAADAALAAEATRRSSGYLGSQLYGSHTPLYASPQQQRGDKPDPRDDVHALGVIGYQMLTGKLDTAPGADFARTLRRLAVNESLIELLGDCAAHDPAHRPRDAAELSDKLARLDAAGPAPPPPEAAQVVPCPQCGVQLRSRVGATALRCARCKTVFNPSAAAARPVVEARLNAAPEPRRSAPAVPVARPDRDRDRDRDRDHDRPRVARRDRPKAKGIHPGVILGAVGVGVFLLIIVVFAVRSQRPVLTPPQPVPPPVIAGPTVPPGPVIPGPPPGIPNPNPSRPQPAPRGADPVKQVRTFTVKALGQAEDLRYSPDGQLLMGVTADGNVSVVTALNGAEQISFGSTLKGAGPLLLADSQTVLTTTAKGGPCTLNIHTGLNNARSLPTFNPTDKTTLRVFDEQVTAVAVSGDGNWLVAGGASGEVGLWLKDSLKITLLQDGKGAKGLKAHSGPIAAMAFGGSFGTTLATASGNTVRVWDNNFSRWDKVEYSLIAGAAVTRLEFARHGHRVVAFTKEQGFNVWEDAGRVSVPSMPASGGVTNVVRAGFSKSPFHIDYAAVGADGSFGFWSGSSVNPINVEKGQPPALDVDFQRDGDIVAFGHKDGSIGIWHAREKKQLVRVTGLGGEVVAVAWNPDGRELASVDKTGRVRVWGEMRLPSPNTDTVEVKAP